MSSNFSYTIMSLMIAGTTELHVYYNLKADDNGIKRSIPRGPDVP